MTATSHSLTGAVIALALKNPFLAIPVAFLSHFALDVIPHYNPPGVKGFNMWSKKFKDKYFRLIFPTDMILFALVLTVIPLTLNAKVSGWIIFLCAAAAASPDFASGYQLLLEKAGGKAKESKFDYFHIGLQGLEKPWGIFVEIVWSAAALTLILVLGR